MGTIVFFDTSLGTFNHGDNIIMESIYREFYPLLENNFSLNFATHLVNYTSKYLDKGKVFECLNADYKFICGTDIIWPNPYEQRRKGVLQLSSIVKKPQLFNGSVFLGAGIKKSSSYFANKKAAKMYKSILSPDLIHSVRDEKAKEFIQSLGFDVINTGCPTLWMLNDDFCKTIPTKKADKCVFSLTTENKCVEADKVIVETIMNNYLGDIYFWIQRVNDEKYLESILEKSVDRIKYVYNLKDYDELLTSENVDYVGTRLHGGIYAMQHRKRAIIISIDHRAGGMAKENNIPCLPRKDILKTNGFVLSQKINNDFSTRIKLNVEGIERFKKQFM